MTTSEAIVTGNGAAATSRRDVAGQIWAYGYTLLGQWLELVRAGRGQTIAEACAEIGIGTNTWVAARSISEWTWSSVIGKLAGYLDVAPDAIEILGSLPADPGFIPTDFRDRVDDRSHLGQEIDRARERRDHATVPQAAETLGVSQVTLWKMRRVGYSTWDRIWERIADYVGCTPKEAEAWAQEAERPEISYPQATLIGIKYHPTVNVSGSCEVCPFLSPCRHDVVERDGFAWCEDMLPVDIDPNQKTKQRPRSDY
jgi:hypothetical protein